MRTNLPVIDREVELSDEDVIVSTTDLKGNIVSVSPDFVRISGFREEELMGQPHNVVRHPDMPQEAFASLWSTVKTGRSWMGIVKNRTKDGAFYWVKADVSSIIDKGVVVGYRSVRTRPTREEISSAAQLYQHMKSGKHQGALIVPRPLSLRLRLFSVLLVSLASLG